MTDEGSNYPENKLLILYILNKINTPITNSILTKIYFSVNDLNYFYFQQYLADLVEKKWIDTYSENNSFYYVINSRGKETLDDLMYLIPSVMILAADSAIKNIAQGIKYELVVSSDFIILDVDKINIKCNINEGSTKLFSLEVYAGSMEQARKIADNWKQNALKYYPKIINMLTDENPEGI